MSNTAKLLITGLGLTKREILDTILEQNKENAMRALRHFCEGGLSPTGLQDVLVRLDETSTFLREQLLKDIE